MKNTTKKSKAKTSKTIAILASTIILATTCLFTLGRNKYYFVDNVTDETYTTKYHWFWEKAEDYYPAPLLHELDDGSGIMVSGIKKTKSGFGIFAKTEYDLVFDEAAFNIHYVLSINEDGMYNEAEDHYTYNGKEDQALRFDFETEETKAGKTIIGWRINDENSNEVYTFIPAGSQGDVHAFPVYSDEVIAEEVETTDEAETSENEAIETVEPTAETEVAEEN